MRRFAESGVNVGIPWLGVSAYWYSWGTEEKLLRMQPRLYIIMMSNTLLAQPATESQPLKKTSDIISNFDLMTMATTWQIHQFGMSISGPDRTENWAWFHTDSSFFLLTEPRFRGQSIAPGMMWSNSDIDRSVLLLVHDNDRMVAEAWSMPYVIRLGEADWFLRQSKHNPRYKTVHLPLPEKNFFHHKAIN